MLFHSIILDIPVLTMDDIQIFKNIFHLLILYQNLEELVERLVYETEGKRVGIMNYFYATINN